jgi:hypothetical protein
VDNARRHCWYGDDDHDGWDLPPPHAAGLKATDGAMLPSPPTNGGIGYNDGGSGRCDKRRGVDSNGKQ